MFGGTIEIRLDSKRGTLIGEVEITNTKDLYKEFTTSIDKAATGVHDLYFVFKGGDIQQRNLFNLDWWRFE
jgi:hypothetical protein